MEQTEVLIVGAGLTGLTVATRLKQADLPCVLLERTPRVGGQIQTLQCGGFTFETGPNTGTLATPETVELFEYLGEDFRPEIAAESAKCRLIYKHGRVHALPSSLMTAVSTPLFTFGDKFRILAEPFRKRGADPHESVGGLATRRLGRSFVDYAVDPFIGGIYAGDPHLLCTRYALPKLHALEAEHGSFIRGAVAKMRDRKRIRDRKATHQVFSTPNGLSTMIHRMVDSIGKERIQCSVQINRIEPAHDSGFIVSYRQGERKEIQLHARHIVSTVGAYALPQLMPFLPVEEVTQISSLLYAPVVEIAVGYRRRPTSLPPAFGCLIPSCENRRILGVLFLSDCFADRAPEGGFLCAVFLGGTRRPDLISLTDQDIRQLVTEELADLIGIPMDVQPDLWHISRHEKAIPQYYADSGTRLEAIQRMERRFCGLHLAGGIRDGIGIANRITQGIQIAEKIIRNRSHISPSFPQI